MNELQEVESVYLRATPPEFRSGDTIRVHVRVKEGDKERIQVFQGVVISRRAKLYYLRDLRGKAARIEERRDDQPRG